MEAVFLGGSRRVSHLNESIRSKLDELIARDLWMFVGDANGADRAIQQHLASRGYEKVVIYAVSGRLRNNIGHWNVQSIHPPRGARGFDLYAAKDIQMAKDACYGLMLWDGKSRGTLENVRNLLAQGKPVAVHFGPERRLVSLRSPADLLKLGVSSTIGIAGQHDLPFEEASDAAQQTAAADGRGLPPDETVKPTKRRSRGARGRS